MVNRDNVIKGLKDIVDFFEIMAVIEQRCNELKQDAENAITLLKEREPKLVLSERKSEIMPFRYERKGFCPTCHQVISWTLNRSFCGFCGQAVTWY